jgi:glycyl-tRNA synthetase beta chain
MRKPLLIEIGVEELPAIPFLKELPKIGDKWDHILKENSLDADFKFYFTPRRLVFICDEFLLNQPDSIQELFGAPLEVAYKDGEPTPAALGFAKKCGVELSNIQSTIKNNKEVLYYKKEIKGKSSSTLLPIMIEKLLKDLNFGKSMRWGEAKESFIRPIRWVGCMLDNTLVDMKIYGVDSALKTYGHRTHTYDALSYGSIDSYLELLKSGSVVLNPLDRKQMILKQFDEIEKKSSLDIERDEELLEEVVAITEHPTALLGEFDEKFLKLPTEVIIASMKEHQRYFPIFKDGVLSNHFIVVSNADTDDYSQIIKGNEKVLYPRLSDALFFYDNDLKNGLSNDGLKKVTFMQGLGSIYDKSVREEKIAQYLLKDSSISTLLNSAVMNAKADLLTDMVYEFTDLQGLMGYYYALEAGVDERVAVCFKEQYLPDGEDSALPSSDLSAIVAMSNKIDSILALFSVGKIPTGTKDPFALRRAVIGIIKIVIDRNFSFDIRADLKELSKDYADFDFLALESFFLERTSNYFNANASVIKAVLMSGERDIVRLSQKIQALENIVKNDSVKESFSTFKRVANIVKDVDLNGKLDVDEKLFEKEQEGKLFVAFKKVTNTEFENYEDQLDTLFGLKESIDDFFDNVMVNAEDKKIKDNRKNLISLIYREFLKVADIKEITI